MPLSSDPVKSLTCRYPTFGARLKAASDRIFSLGPLVLRRFLILPPLRVLDAVALVSGESFLFVALNANLITSFLGLFLLIARLLIPQKLAATLSSRLPLIPAQSASSFSYKSLIEDQREAGFFRELLIAPSPAPYLSVLPNLVGIRLCPQQE